MTPDPRGDAFEGTEMGVAAKAKVTGRGGETSPASMAALTHTLEELERRLARLSDGRGGKPEAAQLDMPAKPATPPQTPSERLRRIVDRSTQQAASMRAKSDMEGFSHDIVGTVVKELSQFRHDLPSVMDMRNSNRRPLDPVVDHIVAGHETPAPHQHRIGLTRTRLLGKKSQRLPQLQHRRLCGAG